MQTLYTSGFSHCHPYRVLQKNSHPQETTEIPCLPPQPPTSMLWSEVPSIINRDGWFFWRPPNTKFRRQHWIGGRGGHDLCGVVLGWLFFLKNPVYPHHILTPERWIDMTASQPCRRDVEDRRDGAGLDLGEISTCSAGDSAIRRCGRSCV